jgi:AcrR family transcriptional regulator
VKPNKSRDSVKPVKRRYQSPVRAAAAARHREAILEAARQEFERHGWAGARFREIADTAGVSQKLVEVLFRNKAGLLQATVDYVIRGDAGELPMPQRQAITHMEQAADAATMLRLHARHVRRVNSRSAAIAFVVEHAAAADPTANTLWSRMNHNRAYAVNWAINTLLTKPGRRTHLPRTRIEATFWIALDWNTYRTLTTQTHLNPHTFEGWLRNYYTDAFLPRR